MVPEDVYLDIETDERQRITVVGFRAAATGLVQLVGGQITPEAVHAALPASGRLFTYNGHCFDLPVIRKRLGLDLRARFDSWDLRFVCQRHGLRGGQKAVEQSIGHRRALEGMDGWEAILLWRRYRRGDDAALVTLLRYNAEDVNGLVLIKTHLDDRGLLVRPAARAARLATAAARARRIPEHGAIIGPTQRTRTTHLQSEEAPHMSDAVDTLDPYRALLLEEHDGVVSAALQTLPRDALPEGDVLVRVAYSALNYKDGLAITGRNKVVRSYPMVPGIDFSGTVVESQSPSFTPGDRVLLTGWGVGERHWGGYAQLARVKSEWLVPVPEDLTLEQVMAIGTAGFTAMLCLMALERHGLAPGAGEALVTGAGGGVGGMAVALLSNLGYTVAASTGRVEMHDYLRSLGAAEIVARATLTAPGGPLGAARWAGAIDTVGGEVLAGVLRTLRYGASIAACGNAGGFDVHTTVLPFILRGVNLLGIDSLPAPLPVRQEAWTRLARELPRAALQQMAHVEPLSALPALAEEIIQGKIRGRVVIDVNA
jgi:acrylyl-CoA reductase (NADPH)